MALTENTEITDLAKVAMKDDAELRAICDAIKEERMRTTYLMGFAVGYEYALKRICEASQELTLAEINKANKAAKEREPAICE